MVGDFTITPQRGPKLPPEAHPWWWHPNRPGVRGAPPSFTAELERFDPTLRVTWDAFSERWSIWAPKPSLRHPICQGWFLLFHVPAEMGLDSRIFARLYASDLKRWANARQYYDALVREFERDKAADEASEQSDAVDHAMESYDFSQIKVSGFGPSIGSKFTTFHV